MLREADFRHGYDKGYEDGQLVIERANVLWEWLMFCGGFALGLMLSWMLKHL